MCAKLLVVALFLFSQASTNAETISIKSNATQITLVWSGEKTAGAMQSPIPGNKTAANTGACVWGCGATLCCERITKADCDKKYGSDWSEDTDCP
jgi:hypothetical protein